MASIRNRTVILHQDSARPSSACVALDGQFLSRDEESKSGSLSHKLLHSLISFVELDIHSVSDRTSCLMGSSSSDSVGRKLER